MKKFWLMNENTGKITISEDIPFKGKSKVLVVLLEDCYKDKNDRKEQLLKQIP